MRNLQKFLAFIAFIRRVDGLCSTNRLLPLPVAGRVLMLDKSFLFVIFCSHTSCLELSAVFLQLPGGRFFAMIYFFIDYLYLLLILTSGSRALAAICNVCIFWLLSPKLP